MSDDLTEDNTRRKRGQLLFALVLLGFAIFLLSQIGLQTTWVEKTKLFAQPRFWPAVGVLGMVLFTAFHLWQLPRRKLIRPDWQEGKVWLSAFEYAAWFLLYVWLVPLLGYLITSVFFVPALSWRMGYRTRKFMVISAGFAVAVVVMFKSVLQVKIPGGTVYEYLPGALRSFFILNF